MCALVHNYPCAANTQQSLNRCRKSHDKLGIVELDLGSTQGSRHHSYRQPVEYDDVLDTSQRLEVTPADNDIPEPPVWEPPRHPTQQEVTDLASPRSLGLPMTASGRVVNCTLGPILSAPGAARTLEIDLWMAGLNLSGLQTWIRYCYIVPRILGDLCSLHSDSCLKVGGGTGCGSIEA